jgi:hypothetical protein
VTIDTQPFEPAGASHRCESGRPTPLSPSGVHMFNRSSIAAGVVVAVAPVLALTPTALAGGGGCGGGFDELTVHVSDSTPASGEQFIVRGHLVEMGMSGKDHAIRVQSRSGGSWHPVAHVRTDIDGKYRVRLILSTTGKRVLRVVAIGQGHENNQATRFVVNVH